MPNTLNRMNCIRRAVLELGIDVPIYRTQAGPNGVIILYAYGGTRYEWDPGKTQDPERTPSPPPPLTPSPTPDPDDLTQIPHVGPATARDLNNAGYHTFQDLNHATDQQLLSLNNVTPLTLQYIRDHLQERTQP